MANERTWNPKERPDYTVCPKQFCFVWHQANPFNGPNPYEAENRELGIVEDDDGYCGARRWGICTRLSAIHGTADMYEPREPALERAGLPWFYFFAGPEQLVEELREQFIRDSADWWDE